MVDFRTLLSKPAGEAKRPAALPAGDYPAIIKSHEVGDNNRNKTPYVRFFVGLTGWPAEVDPNDTTGADGEAIDLAKRQMRRDFYLTDDSLFRLDEFIRSCGVDPAGRTYDSILPEMTGQAVIAKVEQYMNQSSGEVGNQIGALTGQA